ncbi:hypothetical protein CVT26_010290 [Gymnopilus dilepis]|uniref:Uncharacterized protein n=1 Tax=Gymnopilus dilepis TaxID=231916 RepID=A0A409Y0Z0_9AGAR|nr:hypothetical protein CVT26_010290 [Gymnopilus dilepis]
MQLESWTFYWVTTGRINVVISNIANAVVIGGAYTASRAPTNPNSWTVTINRSPYVDHTSGV